MASRNTIRSYQPNSTYHLYNRGVAKQPIFLDQQDYKAFIFRLALSLLPQEEAETLQTSFNRIRISNYDNQVKLNAYCLMPNHFHLMVSQTDNTSAITNFARSISTSYAMYFNNKYDRVGPVFQGKYKAAWVNSDTYLIHLSRYIHCNPIVLTEDIYHYPYSSLQYYFEKNVPGWLKADEVEAMFSDKADYQQFVDDLRSLEPKDHIYEL